MQTALEIMIRIVDLLYGRGGSLYSSGFYMNEDNSSECLTFGKKTLKRPIRLELYGFSVNL